MPVGPVSVQYQDHWPQIPSLIVDGVDVTEKVAAGGITIQHRGPNRPPLVTLTVGRPEVDFDGNAEVALSAETEAILKAAGWRKSEVSA